MFVTELEPVENGYILKVIYGLTLRKWIYREFVDVLVHRARLEHAYNDGKMDTLKEEMSHGELCG